MSASSQSLDHPTFWAQKHGNGKKPAANYEQAKGAGVTVLCELPVGLLYMNGDSVV